MLLVTVPDSSENLEHVAERRLVAVDQRADALVMGGEHKIVQLTPRGCNGQQAHAPILRSGAPPDETTSCQPIRDGRDVALVGEQQPAQLDHRQAVGLAQVVQRPELPRAESKLSEELTVSVVQQQEQVGEQKIQLLLGFAVSRKLGLHTCSFSWISGRSKGGYTMLM